jgi:hypothetical protein
MARLSRTLLGQLLITKCLLPTAHYKAHGFVLLSTVDRVHRTANINAQPSCAAPPPPRTACRWVATKWLHDRAITEWDGEARH